MEREFYTDDFENLLKENADQFKMSPSKKVWHGIYNDLHPGKRWPSAVMSLIFIFSLVIVGHLNTQQSQRNYLTNLQKAPQLQKNIQEQNDANKDEKPNSNSSEKSIAVQTTKNGISSTTKTDGKLNETSFENLKQTSLANNSTTAEETNNIVNNEENKGLVVINNIGSENLIDLSGIQFPGQTITKIILTSSDPNSTSLAFKEETEKNKLNTIESNNTLTTTGHKATHVPVLKIRRNSKVSWTYFLTPTISYRTFSGSKQNGNTGSNLSSANNNYNGGVIQHSSPGLEAGIMMKYSLSKKLKFISGFQTNYSAYTIQANNIHPVMATLILNNRQNMPYPVSSISFYGNGPGSAPINLHNYSLQVSLPVGFEYKLAGNNQVQLNAFSSFQPVFVVANRAYLLSTDQKNYITQSALLRSWNMSSNIGTFVSFNSNKFNWQIGPQVHYQLFSSYTSAYQLREHFIDYGLRVGVSILK